MPPVPSATGTARSADDAAGSCAATFLVVEVIASRTDLDQYGLTAETAAAAGQFVNPCARVTAGMPPAPNS
jgi:hypothetical protein